MTIRWYSQWPSSKQSSVDNSYFNNYLAYDSGYDRMSLQIFQNASNAYSPLTNPSWNNVYDWVYRNLGDANEFLSYTSDLSIVARCIYAENTNVSNAYRNKAMRATADVIMNREAVGMGGNSCSEVVLFPWAFSAMRDGNVGASNPVFYDSDLDAWCYALFIANHMYSYSEPWVSGKELPSNYYHFYDISNSMPFYIYSNGTYNKCTSYNVTNATHYKPGSTYYPITASPIKIENIIYFSY